MSNEHEYTDDIMHDDQQQEETLEEEMLHELVIRIANTIDSLIKYPPYERKYMAVRIDHVDKEVSIVWDLSELELETLVSCLDNTSEIEKHVTVSHRIE